MDRQPPTLRKLKPSTAVALAALLAAFVCAPSANTAAQTSGTAGAKLQDVERKIQSQEDESARQRARADALKSEINAVNTELVAAAKRVQDQEGQVAALESELAKLQRSADVKTEQLRERRRQFSGVIMALSRIARFPTEALIAQPIPPEDTVRSAILLRAAVPAIEVRAAALKGDLQGLASARLDVESRRADLQGALERLRAEEGRIDVIRKKKAALRAEAISKSRAAKSRARKLAKEAKSLRDLVSRLNEQQQEAKAKAAKAAKAKASRLHVAPKTTPGAGAGPSASELAALGRIGSISKARGRLPFPVVGKLIGLYGQPLDGGLTRKGVSIKTRSGGQVISPFDGKVVFAGEFRGYGQLLIIDHGEGYHSLLAGMGRIDAVIDQPVLAGEPVAIMTANNGSGAGGLPILYVEFRRNNHPINPLPWLASRKGTPKG